MELCTEILRSLNIVKTQAANSFRVVLLQVNLKLTQLVEFAEDFCNDDFVL